MFEFSRLSMYCVVPGFVLLGRGENRERRERKGGEEDRRGVEGGGGGGRRRRREGGGVVGGEIQNRFVPICQFSRLVDNCREFSTLNFNSRFVSALCIVRVGCLACSSLFSLVCLVCLVPCSVYVLMSCFVHRTRNTPHYVLPITDVYVRV